MNTRCLSSKVSRNHDVAYTQINTDMVMLDPDMNLFCNVNPTGAVLWTLLENNTLSLDELCKYVHKHYDVTEDECRNDVTQFVEEMAALKFYIITNDISNSRTLLINDQFFINEQLSSKSEATTRLTYTPPKVVASQPVIINGHPGGGEDGGGPCFPHICCSS